MTLIGITGGHPNISILQASVALLFPAIYNSAEGVKGDEVYTVLHMTNPPACEPSSRLNVSFVHHTFRP
jgi:hypothetical protein